MTRCWCGLRAAWFVVVFFFAVVRSGELTMPSRVSFDPAIHLTPLDVAVNWPAYQADCFQVRPVPSWGAAVCW